MADDKRIDEAFDDGFDGNFELTDEQLEGLAGGYLFFNGGYWQILDENGKLLDAVQGYNNRLRAEWRAYQLGQSAQEITMDEIEDMRYRAANGLPQERH